MNIKDIIKRDFPHIAKFALWYKDNKRKNHRAKDLNKIKTTNASNKQFVFYLGVPEHSNLGDLAQSYCIKKWILENYPEAELLMVDLSVITDDRFTNQFIIELRRLLKPNDIIVFQSGYNTQDLGGDQPKMHELIIDAFPNANILMMPQTIFFQYEENKRACSENHNKAHNMLFLARDFISYAIAQEMFPNIRVKAYPDIVTTMIGTFNFNHQRNGVCLCTRNDGEKLYSDNEIKLLVSKFKSEGIKVFQKDTQSKKSYRKIRANLQQIIESEIESYSYYDVTITDRYHGTIFSLCAGTPVIVLKTTDHKVTTGVDWFKGIYDGYVFVAEDLDDAFVIYHKIINNTYNHYLEPYFKKEYYDKLRILFDEK